VRGSDAKAHLEWQCQKQPCTRITHLSCLFAKSGLPGNERTCVRYRNPMEYAAERVRISGVVFSERILDMTSERLSGGRLRVGMLLCLRLIRRSVYAEP
jgi:hypothetical protein